MFFRTQAVSNIVRTSLHDCVRANCHGVGSLELPRKVVPSLSRRKTRRESLAPTTHAEYDTYGYRAQPFFMRCLYCLEINIARCLAAAIPNNAQCMTCPSNQEVAIGMHAACNSGSLQDSCALRTPHAIIGTYNAAKQHCHAGHELCCPHIRNTRAPGSAFTGNAHLTILILLARRLNFLPALKMWYFATPSLLNKNWKSSTVSIM